MRLIWKLLRKHISITELAIFFVANLIGMVVILSGIQLYSDVKPMLTGEKRLIGNDYMILTHPVERFGSDVKHFSDTEIEELGNQPFVKNIGTFQSSQYEVMGSIVFNGSRLSTMMFFEAVPDIFIDVESNAWHFEKGDKNIPIIIPRNYLNLYNFGFSQTQSLPQITEDMIKRVELGIELRGNGKRDMYKGYIVGFSDRLNTILVPMTFMEWANNHYAAENNTDATRLIIEVANPADPEVQEYLSKQGYVAEDKPSESGKALFLLKVCVVVIVFIGLIFSILSIIIFMLSIYLLLQKNIDKLNNLMLIGYSLGSVTAPYNIITIALNIAIYAVSIVAVVIIQSIYTRYLSDIAGYELSASPLTSVLSGLCIILAIISFNLFIIRRKVKHISRKQ